MAHLDNRIGGGDQAQRLRHLMIQGEKGSGPFTRNGPSGCFAQKSPDPFSPPPRAHVIAVLSGKGGVGKTLISVNLSIALAARGHSVMLMDMDMGLANADIILGIDAACTWSEVLAGRKNADEAIVQAPGGIAFLPGASGVARMANLSEFERHQLLALMERIEGRYDVVMLDCGAGISQNVLAWAAVADTLLVVATPEPTALTDAYAVIKTFSRMGREAGSPAGPAGTIGIMVNNAENRREGVETFERLAGTAARFLHIPVTDYGCIPRDEHVPAAVRQRRPLVLRYPRCPASAGLMASAVRLSAELGRPECRQSLFYRVMSMFV